jgi:hypothetical protein
VLAFVLGQTLVDIMVILVALFSFLVFALLGYAAWQIVGLVKDVRGEVDMLIGATKETLTEVRGTARFVGETVIGPATRAAGFMSMARAVLRSFTEPVTNRRS